jgi:BlaI family transcriptional regulator, penicillinase repressor
MGEGTVREIHERLAERRPRAYTTIMTIMDRLTRKGIVDRRKAGRAYIYRANLSVEDARATALSQVVENFFGGSKEALKAQLDGRAHAASKS